MPAPHTSARPSDGDYALSASADGAEFSALIGPMLAGAQARGVADTLDLLDIGAALIDATGRVLHIGNRGRRAVTGWLRIVEDHLIAERSEDNMALQQLIGTAIDDTSVKALQVQLGGGQGSSSLKIRAMRFPRANGVDQLLRAVLTFEDVSTA